MTRPYDEYDVSGVQWADVVAPDDTALIPPTRGLYVGVGGDIVVEFAGKPGQARTLKNVATGSTLVFQLVKVKLAGTTASNLLALY